MIRQSTTAWLIIVIQGCLFWFLAEGVVFPIIVCVISLLAVIGNRQWEISSQTLPLVDLALATFCAMQWYLAPCELRRISPFVMYPLVHAAAQFFLLVQVARLWGRRPDRLLPAYFPMLAILVFICLGDIDASRRQRLMYQDLALLLVGLICAFYGQIRQVQTTPKMKSSSWLRFGLSIAVLVVALFSIRAGNAWLRSKWDAIEQWLAQGSSARSRRHERDVMAGFSGNASLDSVRFLKRSLNQEVALRIESDDAPGYLRGAVFEQLTDRSWNWNSKWQPASQSRKPESHDELPTEPSTRPGETIRQFVVRAKTERRQRPMTIWRESAVERFTFLPLTTTALEVKAESIVIDRHGIIIGEVLPGDLSVKAWVADESFTQSTLEPLVQPPDWNDRKPFRLTDEQHLEARMNLLQLPHQLNPEVVRLAERLFENCETPMARVQAVKQYFASYRYAPGIKIPPDEDPVSYFLLSRPAAHCEMFASGAAILLRLGGIPCRYVTGYAGAERNSIGKYWIVRQADAHAWVEAYLPDRGWTIVETTPGDGMPITSEKLNGWHVWDEINLRGQMIRAALSSNTWAGTLLAMRLFSMTLLNTIPGWMFTGGVLFLLLRQITWTRRDRKHVEVSQSLLDLRRLLDQLETRLRRLKLHREPHETLHRFAERLRTESSTRPALLAAADWYMQYAATRYRDSTADIAELRQELQAVCQQLSKPKKVNSVTVAERTRPSGSQISHSVQCEECKSQSEK